MEEFVLSKIKEHLVNFEEELLLEEVNKQLDEGTDPMEIFNSCQEGLTEIGELFSAKEMFVSDLMMSGALFKSVSELLLPKMKTGDNPGAGKVILGTVKDDIHDIGKDIVRNMLIAANFDVIDLGVDVPAEQFVSAVKEHEAPVLALSCLLASCYSSILEVVEAVKAAGLRDKVKIIIGGGPVDEHVVTYSGADAMGESAQDAVIYCREVICK